MNQPKLAEIVFTNCITLEDPAGYLVLYARKQHPGTIQVTGEDILSYANRNHNISGGRQYLQRIIGYLEEENEME